MSSIASRGSDTVPIAALRASEILDSRGRPTLEVRIAAGEVHASASVPSGKSTGRHEARELRDGDRSRYRGEGVLRAVESVNRDIASRLIGRPLPRQISLDDALIALDGTPDKSRLGANAIVGVSLAAARLRAKLAGRSLVGSLIEEFDLLQNPLIPIPCFNVINGGAHAPNALEFQEFMLVPAGRPSFREALRAGAETYHALGALLADQGMSTAVGDEGGFAPAIASPVAALDLLVRAIEAAGYRPGEDICIALDPAANGFFHDGAYHIEGRRHSADDLTALYGSWLGQYPIVSIEDGLAEDDREGWKTLTRALGGRVQVMGDDIFVSDARRVRDAAADGIANAVLLKPNQVGTVTEIVATARAAHENGFNTMMSHRSGETIDAFISDLAVALRTGQIKAGAPARGERLAKYNRLLELEDTAAIAASFSGRDVFRVKRR